MDYKTLLAIHTLHDTLETLEPVVAIANRFEAHLEILVLSEASPIPTMTFVQDPEYDWSNSFTDILEKNNQLAGDVSRWIRNKGVSHDVTACCQLLGLIDDDVARSALYADLVLYSRGYQSLVSGMMSKALEGTVFDASKPALVLAPGLAAEETVFQNICIAWDAVPGAMKALSASLPLLLAAATVELAIVSPTHEPKLVEAHTHKVTDWLRRHGVAAEPVVVHQEDKPVSKSLVDYINANGADLIVMGAYGHSRFTEKLLSGVSHEVLQNAKTSLFIAH
jgi:nucleotide-binding universal stress UspA family protein